MRSRLEERYKDLFRTYHLENPVNVKNINSVIRHSLRDFMEGGRKTAIYCGGGHTKMLMADFMFELKGVDYIIDNYADASERGGFRIIKEEEIEENGIEAVIISSFKFKDAIIESLKKKHPDVEYLNIYDKLAENGIIMQADYYYHSHPYQHYHRINSLQRKTEGLTDKGEIEQTYISLITIYIQIKDFKTAAVWAERLFRITGGQIYGQMAADLRELYEWEKAAAAQIAEDNVLMFCMDGLRRQDMTKESMPKLTRLLGDSGFVFDNAYSFSTSTFESLLPVYSENDDLRTGYYNRNFVKEEDCRFLREAARQRRSVFFYTDMNQFTKGDQVRYSGAFQTVTEKLWDFILCASEEDNGLYYIHILYESHFTFSNPYTESELISEGTAMLFDFLPQKGGRLRADYERQHLDALRYLDDVVAPILERLRCRMLLFSDHGNIILKQDCGVEDIKETKLSCDEEWIRIVYAIRSPEMGVGRCKRLVSLMSLNDIIVSLMNGRPYEVPENAYVKIARSELYNPDFRFLYRMLGKEKYLLAFEAFVFSDGYKLAVYSDGSTELLLTSTDQRVEDEDLLQERLKEVWKCITVWPERQNRDDGTAV